MSDAMQVQGSAITCRNHGCGIVFTVPNVWEKERRRDHKGFWCPNGHSLVFHAESDEDKFRRERDLYKQQVARAEDEARAAQADADEQYRRATKAEAKARRLVKRAAAGTCPCCKRTFKELAEHMKHQHPEFVKGTGANVIPMKRRAARG